MAENDRADETLFARRPLLILATLFVVTIVFISLLSLQWTMLSRQVDERLFAINNTLRSIFERDDERICASGAVTTFSLIGPFSKIGDGYAYRVDLPDLNDFADDANAPYKSAVGLCEGKVFLGPRHSPHADIMTFGLGRYSHWREFGGFMFSTSDNTDPNVNGRRYLAVRLQ